MNQSLASDSSAGGDTALSGADPPGGLALEPILQNLQVAVWLADPEMSRLQYLSPGFEKIWGLGRVGVLRDRSALIGAVYPEDRDQVLRAWAQLPGAEANVVFRVIHPDGLIRWLHDRAIPLRDGDGKVYRIAGYSTDVTAEHDVRDAYRESEARYRRIVDTATEGIFSLDAIWRVTFANAEGSRLLGFDPGALLGRHLLDLVDESQRSEVEPALLRSEAGSGVRVETRLSRGDGSTRWVILSVQPMRSEDEGFLGAIATVTDISERRAAEEALHHQNERLELVAQIDAAILAAGSPQEVVSLALPRARRLVSASYLSVFVFDLTAAELKRLARDCDADVDAALPSAVHPLSAARLDDLEHDVLVVQDLRTRPEGPQIDRNLVEAGLLSGVLLRLSQAGRGPASFLMACYRKPDAVTPERLAEVKDIGALFSVALEQARLREEVFLQSARLRRDEERLRFTVELTERASGLTEKQILDLVVEKAASLTSSPIAYIHFMNEDQVTLQLVTWNEEALRGCSAVTETHFPIDKAGVWADSARLKLPVVHNDFQALATKKGYPEGHVPLFRHLSIPILDGQSVRIIAGVGNKSTDYDDHDTTQLQHLFRDLLRIVMRRRAELALVESEARQRALLEELGRSHTLLRGVTDGTTDVVFVKDREGRYLMCNPAGLAFFGSALEEVIGKTDEELFPPESAASLRIEHEEILATGASRTPERELRANDRTATFLTALHPYRDPTGTILGVIGLARDITARKAMEREVEASRQQYERLVESIDGIVWEADPVTFQFTFVSRQAEQILGYPVERWTGEPTFWVDQIHPDDREATVAFCRVETAGGRHHDFEYRMIASDGRTVWLRDMVSVTTDASGRPVAIRGLMVDVTRPRAAELALRKSEDHLRQAQKLDAIGRLAGGLAHDFANVLTTVMAHADLLASKLDPASPLRRHTDGILSASDRAAAMTRQLLAVGRRQVLEPRVLDLRSTVAEMVPLLERLVGDDIEIHASLDPSTGFTMADPGQLTQILLNLAVNARDAMPQGGSLSLETSNVEPEDGGPDPRRFVRLSVRDTGVGMDEEQLLHVFEPFYTTKSGKGSGLGLSIVLGIVEQSGGRVAVRSEPGKGSVFEIFLPCLPRLPRTPSGAWQLKVGSGPASLAPGAATVLVVDDGDEIRQIICEVLQSAGYRVVSCRSGDEAIERSRAEDRVDLLLTDIVMPRIDGRELSRILGADRPSLRVLYMSGYADHAPGDSGPRTPGTSFLQKPFTPDSLLREVQKAFEKPAPSV